VQITLNTENKGAVLRQRADGDFLIRVGRTKAMGLVAVRGRAQIIDGEEMIALIDRRHQRQVRESASPGASRRAKLPVNTVDFAGRKQNVFYPTNQRAFSTMT
jgi:hypothetical protein